MPKNLLITIRVDEADRTQFNAAARAVGASLSVYARDAIYARMMLEGSLTRERDHDPYTAGGERAVSGDTDVGATAPGSLVSDPSEVPAAVERVASHREFTPFSKESQAGRRPKEKR